MSHIPWTQEQAEKWAHDMAIEKGWGSNAHEKHKVFESGFLAGLQKAAEMIEAAPTVYAATMADLAWHRQHFEGYGMRANLVGVRPIEWSEK